MCDSFTFICHITFNRRSTLRWRWCNRAVLRLVRRETKVKTTRLRFKSIQPCYLRFSRRFPKYIYYWRFRLPMNHVSFLEADILVSKKKERKKIKQSVVKWYEPNCPFKMINFYVSYPLFLSCFFFFHYSLLYLIVILFFYPRQTWHVFVLSMRFTGKETWVKNRFSLLWKRVMDDLLPPQGFRPTGEIPRRHSSNSRIY